MWWQCIRRQWRCKSHHTSPWFSHQPPTTSPTLSRLQCTVSRAPSYHRRLSLTHVCTWTKLQNDGKRTPMMSPPRPVPGAWTWPIAGRLRLTLRIYFMLVCAPRERPVGGYSTSCLSSPWLNCIVRSWQSRSRLLSFNNLCCLTKPAKLRITLKYSNGTQLRQRRLAPNPIPAGVYFSN